MNKPWFSNHFCSGAKEFEFSNSMRLLWEQHVYWTRMTVNSIAFELPDEEPVTARLLQNATDMGDSLRPFYGNRIAGKYGSLIRDHLVVAAELVIAARDGDQRAAADARRRWFINGEEISEFVSKINPFISREEFQEMFFEHLELTELEAVLILQQNFRRSIAVFDEIERQALDMADTLTKAIVKQFPKKFK